MNAPSFEKTFVGTDAADTSTVTVTGAPPVTGTTCSGELTDGCTRTSRPSGDSKYSLLCASCVTTPVEGSAP